MDLSFAFFWKQVLGSPALMITVFLTLCVIFVNGWTDAPNAIATCVSTRSMDVELAIIMAAVCNFAGVMVMTMVNSTVAMTITNMVNFGGDNHRALIALCAALFAIVAWAVLAWYFGIPTSESHALIAGLSGAALQCRVAFGASMAVNGSRSSTDWDFRRFWGLFWAFLSASWYPFCAGDSTGEGQTVFLRELRSEERQLWLLCMALKMGRSFWGYCFLESVCPEEMTMQQGSGFLYG